MHAVDYLIIAIVAVAFFFAARRAGQTFAGKRDCCSGDKKSSAKSFPTRRIADTDESHYPYECDVAVKGMHCENCARNVTNALDSIDGTWATVDFTTGTAHVRSKNEIDRDAYGRVVKEAGYSLA